MAKRRIKYISAHECSTIKMVAGNEKKFSVVIDMVPTVKRWVGMGWVNEREADADDLLRYPVVKRKE